MLREARHLSILRLFVQLDAHMTGRSLKQPNNSLIFHGLMHIVPIISHLLQYLSLENVRILQLVTFSKWNLEFQLSSAKS